MLVFYECVECKGTKVNWPNHQLEPEARAVPNAVRQSSCMMLTRVASEWTESYITRSL